MSFDWPTSVALDGFLSSLIIPLRSQTSFFAMQSFGEYDAATLQMAAGIAALSAAIGHMANYAAGRAGLALAARYKPSIVGTGYRKFQRYFFAGGLLTLCFSWLPLFSLFSLVAGFFALRVRYTFFLLLAGQAAYFIYYLQ